MERFSRLRSAIPHEVIFISQTSWTRLHGIVIKIYFNCGNKILINSTPICWYALTLYDENYFTPRWVQLSSLLITQLENIPCVFHYICLPSNVLQCYLVSMLECLIVWIFEYLTQNVVNFYFILVYSLWICHGKFLNTGRAFISTD